MKKAFAIIVLSLVFLSAAYVSVAYYSYVFAKSVSGEILRVERVTSPETVITGGGSLPASQVFSFAIAIRDAHGDIHTASSEDRQWAVAQSGQCAEAKFFPYAPWHLDKAGTYYGARLIRLYDCPAKK